MGNVEVNNGTARLVFLLSKSNRKFTVYELMCLYSEVSHSTFNLEIAKRYGPDFYLALLFINHAWVNEMNKSYYLYFTFLL